MNELVDLSFKSPPIWESAISAHLPSSGWYNSYDVREVHDLFRDRFPSAERQQPFIGFNPFPVIGTPMVPNTFQIGGIPDFNRWWFVSETGQDLIQIQEDMIARNWRRLVPPPEALEAYPGFDALYGDFRDIVRRLNDRCVGQGTPFPQPDKCELTYENLIPLVGSDGERLRLSEVVAPLQFAKSVLKTGLSLSWYERIEGFGADGQQNLQVLIQQMGVPILERGSSHAFVKIVLIARNPCSSWEDAFSFIEGAHSHIRQSLLDLTTDVVRARWNLS